MLGRESVVMVISAETTRKLSVSYDGSALRVWVFRSAGRVWAHA
jgi:hypothetical protein